MSTAQVQLSAPRKVWIVSAWWDLAYLIITPVAIVPALLIAVRQWLTPEQVYLAAISFASLGHHLPGFMRAYGERELFRRFRTRFLLAPPLVFCLALLFSPPSGLANALHLPWVRLHGLELILFVWGTWHGLMQTYGFMRIYDIRRGENDRRTARLDHALCLSIFIAGVVFSDGRMFEIVGTMWQSGLPTLQRDTLVAIRWVVGAATAAVLAAYVADLLRRKRQGLPLNGVKLLLAAITGWFYWYCGRISNLLVGVAMFEIFHAVQYSAIVWIYNRRLFERVGNRFGPLGFLFRDRLVMLCTYLALIGAYSSIRFFTAGANDRVFHGSQDAHHWLIALFVTSSFLHFYYDGFIWKVSDRDTQQNLVDKPDASLSFERFVPAMVHASRWAVLLLIAGGLALAEQRSTRTSASAADETSDVDRLRSLAQLTPDLPEGIAWRVIEALQAGENERAIELARRAAEIRPRSHQDQARLADALRVAGRYEEAVSKWRQAVELHPTHWPYRIGLAECLDHSGETLEAEIELLAAIDMASAEIEPRRHLAELYRRHNQPDQAIKQLEKIVASDPQDITARLALGGALGATGQFGEGIAELTTALEADPNSAEGHYRLGLTILQSGEPGAAIAPLRRAVELNPDHLTAHLQLGDAYYALGKWRLAVIYYEKAVAARPDVADAWVNLASAQLNEGSTKVAEATLRRGLDRLPDSSALQFTLGYLLQETGRDDEGRALLRRAEEAGLKIRSGSE